MVLAAALLTLSMQVAQPAGAGAPKQGPVVLDCALAMAQGANALAAQACLGDQQLKLGEAAPKGSAERQRHFEDAVSFYRKAEATASSAAIKAAALEMLARLHDAQRLNDPVQLELVLRELATVTPDDLTVLFRLSRVQEEQHNLDTAETTLLYAHRLRPAEAEPNRMLAQFYARRVAELSLETSRQISAQQAPAAPDQPDQDGFYHVGGTPAAPRRLDNPKYPKEAQDAGIEGIVTIEISLNEAGVLTDARVLRSIPLLDEAALDAVRHWAYEPAVINGRAVPARMTVTVNFSTRK